MPPALTTPAAYRRLTGVRQRRVEVWAEPGLRPYRSRGAPRVHQSSGGCSWIIDAAMSTGRELQNFHSSFAAREYWKRTRSTSKGSRSPPRYRSIASPTWATSMPSWAWWYSATTERAARHHGDEDPGAPGEVLREDVLAELGLGVGQAASRLGISRVALSRVMHGHTRISPNLAVRLVEAGVGTARTCLATQTAHDLAAERATGSHNVRPLNVA